MWGLLVAILLWVVGMPVALALVARFAVARTARSKRRVSLVAICVIGPYVTLFVALLSLSMISKTQGLALVQSGCCLAAVAAVAPLVGGIILCATEFPQRMRSAEVCNSCGYPRQGAAGATCPECGERWQS